MTSPVPAPRRPVGANRTRTPAAHIRAPRAIRPVVAVVTVLAALGLAPAAQAQQTGAPAVVVPSPASWSVQPSSAKGPDGRSTFVYELDPGATVRDTVRVNNLSKKPLLFRVYSGDAFNTPDGKFSLLPGDQKPTEVGAWVALNNRRVQIPAGGHVDLPFVLRIPKHATPGDHAGGIVASLTDVKTEKNGSKVLVENRVGARIYLRVHGDLQPAVAVTGMSATFHQGWIPFAGGSLSTTYTIKNTGNMRVAGGQHVDVQGPLGVGLTTIGLANLPELLPGQSYTVTTTATHVQRAGRINVQAKLDPTVPHAVANDPEPPSVTGAAATWAIPLPELAVLALLLLAIAALLRVRRTRRQRAADELGTAVAKARADALAEARAGQA
ncbi:WxL protein peptidoglycan domain-containing protein [Kribbella sp. GL6]|uniref:WxL protein peptidoglycan domain-containing protein n=1 Tax=Kribbella sp. GL6 TaxID=3419765 RepID=UPI003D056F88